MTTTAKFAVTFVIYQTFYIVLSIITITSGLLTRFYLSVMYDNHIIQDNTFESFSFTTKCMVYIGVVMIIVSLMSCSLLINENRRTVLLYLLIMLVVIAVEVYVEYHTFEAPNKVKEFNEKKWNKIFGNISTSEDSFQTSTNNDAILIQQSLQCCGFNNSTYWKDNNKAFMKNYCCKQTEQSNNTKRSCDQDNIWHVDCLTKVTDIARKTNNLLFVIILISITFKVTGIMCFLLTYKCNKY